MLFPASLLAFAPLFLLILAVRAQVLAGRYIIVNTATGLVFEDRRDRPLEVGNTIVGAPYDATRVLRQSWSLPLAPGFAFYFRNDRLVGHQTVWARANGSEEGGPRKLVTTQDSPTSFIWQQVYPAPGIVAFLEGLLAPVAITAPKVANGTLTLEPYDATNPYQQWILDPVPGPRYSGGEGLSASAKPVANAASGKKKGATEG